MDRLLVGDVGFGKTEVAVRAAFKAVMDGRQVAIARPDTVLAAQHFETIRERFAAYPVRLEMISRFRAPTPRGPRLAGAASGEVDMVVGTHRLLSKDVTFHRLGLLVVDEEQRFGVAAKERLKQLAIGIDVLSMTATRSRAPLQMSLAGVRDLSIIETPPAGRSGDPDVLGAVPHQRDRPSDPAGAPSRWPGLLRPQSGRDDPAPASGCFESSSPRRASRSPTAR
jgi:transcription-repair coupling factor (superfamily II helicase)